ncbi:MAG: type VI secretion system tube protein Hcp [Planctomycetes bacterium]|nr:type VI secretion system tube protein Hcp [Planctomycetota bacterium]
MTMYAILKLVGENLGEVKGSARGASDSDSERKGKIVVLAYDHTVTAEATDKTDLGGKAGTPSDKRTHGLFTITKQVDRASPTLQKAAGTGEVFPTFVMQCFRVPPAGGGPKGVREEGHWKVVLKNARIASIKTYMLNVRVPKNSSLPEMEEVAFTYETIGFGWKALTGNAGEEATVDAAAMAGDFSKSDGHMIAKRIVDGAIGAVSKDIGTKVAAFLKDEGKKMFLDALKEK